MANTAFSGPLVVFGQNPQQPFDSNPDIGGSSLFYAGTSILDPRPAYTFNPGQAQSATDFGWLGVDNITTLSAVPYTASATAIINAATPVGGTTSTLTPTTTNSATTGVYSSSVFVRADTGVTDTVLALDAYVSCTASFSNGVMTVTANSGMPIGPGMAVVSTSGTVSQGTVSNIQVVSQLTIVTTSNNYQTTPQGTVGTYQTNSNLTATSGTVTLAYQTPTQCAVPNNAKTPSMRNWSPMALLGRAVSVTAQAAATYTTATVNGYDVYGYPMSENITLSAGSAVNGRKAFKYVKNVVLSGGTSDTTHTYSVGTIDVFGLPLRSDSFGDLLVNYATASVATTLVTAASSYLTSDRNTATATTGDVRGTYAATSSTGVNKLVIRQSPQAYMVPYSTGLFGVTQYSAF